MISVLDMGFGILETGDPNRLHSFNGNILELLILTEISQTAPISNLQLPEAFGCLRPVLFHTHKVCLSCKTALQTGSQTPLLSKM